MNKILIALPIIALLTLGAVFLTQKQETHHLTNSSNTTSFTKFRTCNNNLKHILCESIEDEAEKSLCYLASYGVSRLTYEDGDLLLDSCKKFIEYQNKATANQMINQNNYYFSCFLSGEVLKQAYQSKTFYEQIYTPLYITCAGY